MCVTFAPPPPIALQNLTGASAVAKYPAEAYPGYLAPVLSAEGDATAIDGIGLSLGVFGLIPHWSKDRTASKRTYNARTETVAEKPSYRTAWRKHQFCIVPMAYFYEPCWETGKAVRWGIYRQDHDVFGVAAIWDTWTDKASGEIVRSFSLLTINADGHPVMGRFHKPEDEKRSLVVVERNRWRDWVEADAKTTNEFLLDMPASEFTAEPAQVAKAQTGTAQATLL
jgi:putative SOS response-associated peptidase YedK